MLEQAEPIAYDIGLKPWEFWRLTPAELDALVEAAHRREEREAYRAAWLACHVYRACFQAFGGKKGARIAAKITPEKLLGLKPPKRREPETNVMSPSARRTDEATT